MPVDQMNSTPVNGTRAQKRRQRGVDMGMSSRRVSLDQLALDFRFDFDGTRC